MAKTTKTNKSPTNKKEQSSAKTRETQEEENIEESQGNRGSKVDEYYNSQSSSSSLKPEAIFYRPPSTPTKTKKVSKEAERLQKQQQQQQQEEDDELEVESYDDQYDESRCVQISYDRFKQQSIDYTNQQLENLSREIRRHPNIALKSYHFLNRGLSTKITHQLIRIVLSTILLVSMVTIVFMLPLPEITGISLHPTTPNIQYEKDGFHLSNKITPFKENWNRFSFVGMSNFLCCDYNFNPFDPMTVDNHPKNPVGSDDGRVHYDQREQDLKNIRIFASTVVFGIVYFCLWLFASRLAEKEIIMDSNAALQVLHSVVSLYLIPLISMIFWALVSLYFVQTLLIGPGQVQSDILHCISTMSSSLSELLSFSPLRELILGAVGISMRVLYNAFGFSISSLTMHSKQELSDNQMKLVSFVWALIIGSIIYHFAMIISYLYSIFRERTVKPEPTATASSTSTTTTTTNNGGITSTSTTTTTSTLGVSSSSLSSEAPSLVSLDLKFLPSFIPEVLLTQNFIIVFIWTLVSCYLWAFGSPIANTHEGEIFFIFLTSSSLIQSIYQLIVILQKKDTIEKLHEQHEFLKVE
ncbi:hypothetical protein DLAC_09708 [Tieghemostelium lacteum]|uniref:Transmembrane protein n=1 Tax=Tieghemostelium lacteum TaxID=361077 RepID=A0A151Z6Z9_TIELA|nr:hypothetical protein DLAC_09708 [Tieghemostelium lacteum]|eukprot:KYQ89740.1 hypothetical protein DLAC_09708 [Tieghemostelium lacteum]